MIEHSELNIALTLTEAYDISIVGFVKRVTVGFHSWDHPVGSRAMRLTLGKGQEIHQMGNLLDLREMY